MAGQSEGCGEGHSEVGGEGQNDRHDKERIEECGEQRTVGRGEVTCWISEGPIREGELCQMTPRKCHGAQNYFFGSVRDFNLGKKVVAVSYDAYIPLGEKILKELAQEAQDRWGLDLRICVVHRVGQLAVGEVSVGIGVSSAHREEAYQASRYIIEQIKLRAPIWKKEHYEDGETEWLKGHALCSHHKSKEMSWTCHQ